MSGDPTRPMGGWPPEGQGRPGWPEQPPAHAPGRREPGYQEPGYRQDPGYRPRRRSRFPLYAGITVVVIIILLVVGDRVAAKVAENQIADKIQSSGFPAKPGVDIEGFPFLTQVLAHDLRTVKITARNVQEGPLEISSIDATATGVHLNSGFTGATVDQINGTALITFASLANASGASGGVTLSAGGPNQVKVTAGVGPISDTAVAQVSRSGPSQISVRVVDGGGIPTSLLGSLADFTVNVPKLPAGLQIQDVSVTQQGLSVTASAQHTTLSE